MADPLIASAFVKIKPEPTSVSGFGKDVRTKIEKSFTRPIRIKVQPQLLPFKAKIQKELSSAVFTIKVTPVLAPGFKQQVSRLAKEAAAGITIPVKPIVPVGKATGAGKPAATAAARGPALSTAAGREAKFQSELTKLTHSRAAAVRKLSEAQQLQGNVSDRLKAANTALAKTDSVLDKHLATQDRLVGSLTVKQQARLATAVKQAQQSVATAAGLKAELEATIAATAAEQKRDAQAKIRTDLDVRRLALAGQIAAVEKAGALSVGNIAAARARLTASTAALAAAETLHRDAMATEDVQLQKLTGRLLEKAGADRIAREEAVKSAIADEKAGQAAATRAARTAQATKGLLATALAAAGARGATLAASFEFLAGAAIATGLFKSVQLAAKLEEELNVFQVTAAATADEMARIGEEARKLGADITLPGVSANTAAEAMTELAKAGLSVEDSMGAARGTLQLATAAQIETGTAVNITASALNAFGLAGTQATHVADLLAGAARESQGGIDSMGAALGSVASVARQAGVTIEDTIALLTLLTKNGIQGAESGTALRVALLRLIAPTKKAKDELDKLNISVLNSAGNFRPEVFSDIAIATGQLSASERNLALQTIFGTRAIRAQAVLGREGAAGLNLMRDSTNQMGLAAEDAGARTKGFGGQIEALKNSMSTLGETLGKGLIPLFGGFVDTGIEVVNVIQDIDAGLKDLDKRTGAGEEGGFFAGVKDVLGTTGGEFKRDIEAFVELTRKNRGVKLGAILEEGPLPGLGAPIRTMEILNEEVAKAVDNADELALSLNSLGADADVGKGGPVGAQVVFLQKLRSEIFGSSEEAVRLKARIDGVIQLLTNLGRAPTALELKVFFEKGGVDQALLDVQRQINQARINIEMGLDKKSVVFLGASAKQAAEAAAKPAQERFTTIFGEQMAANPLGRAVWDPLFLQAPVAAGEAGKKSAAAFSLGFETEIAVLEATGAGDSAILSKLQEKLVVDQSILTRAQAKYAKNKTKANKDFVDRAAREVSETQSQIESIASKQESERKSAADAIITARNKADQAFLDALGLSRGRAENAILRAEGREGLVDDIKTHTVLRDLLVRKRDEAAKTLKDAKTRAETVQALTADIIQENNKIADLNRQLVASISTIGEKFETRIEIASFTGGIKKLRKLYSEWIDELQKALGEAKKGSKIAKEIQLTILQTQQAAFDAINEGFELDISIAEAQERPGAEIKARARFIEQLKRERDQFKKGTLEYKRLTLEIINQQKAIDEAKGALKDRNDAFAQMSFEFLTTMQGFSANVMGNLLPLGAIGGTVAGKLAAAGGSSGDPLGGGTGRFQGRPGMGGDNTWPPGAAGGVGGKGAGGGPAAFLGESGRQSDAASAGGFTPSQAATLIALTRQIVILLGGMDKKAKHPESKRKQLAGSSSYDTQ